MSSITLYANKNGTTYSVSRYWKVSDNSGAAVAENSLYAGVTSGGYNRRTRITFFPKSSTFTNQTITSVSLTLQVKSLYTSANKTLDTNIRISSTNEDTNTAYSAATACGVISAKEVGRQFTFYFPPERIAEINEWCKNGTQFSIYLGIDDGGGKYGVQYQGYKSSNPPILTINYQPSASTGSISNNPKIGSYFRVNINKVSGTNYTHKIIISSSVTAVTLSSGDALLSTNIAYKDFIISAGNTLNWISSSSVTQNAKCLIETYNDNTKIGEYSFDFTLSRADTLSVGWDESECSIIGSTNINGNKYLISGYSYPTIKLQATTNDGSTITKYRIEINSCGAYLNRIYNVSSGYLSIGLSDIKPYTSSNTNFIIKAYAINSFGIESASKEISKTCYAYALPSTILNPIRALNPSGTANINGKYIYNKTPLNYTSIEGNNLITDVTVEIEGITGSPTVNLEEGNLKFYQYGALTESDYDVTVTITDKVATNTIKAKIPSANFLIHIKKDGKSLGLGSAAGADRTIKLGWKLLVNNGIEFYDSKGNIAPLTPDLGGTGYNSIEGLKKGLGIEDLDYLPLSGGKLTGSLIINGGLTTNSTSSAISLKGNSFTYNGNDVLVLNKNVFYSSEAPSNPSIGMIWFKI